MFTKAYFDGGSRCCVTFHVPPEIRARITHLCGEFNDWSTRAHPMERQADGSFSLTLELKADHDYCFWLHDFRLNQKIGDSNIYRNQEVSMIHKSYSKNGKTCRVTFEVPAGTGAERAFLCADFTEWEKTCIPMKRRKDGSFTSAVTLKTGQEYYFRYLLDEGRWENDEAADQYVPNPFGSDDCVISV